MQTISRARIQTEARTNDNPDFGPLGPMGFTAAFHYAFCLPEGVRGCPLGRGETEESAISDLLERTNRESGLDLVLVGARGSL